MSAATKTVSEVEFIFEYHWTKADIFSDYLQDAKLIGFYRDENPCGLAVVKQQPELLEIVEIYCKDEEERDRLFCHSMLLDRAKEMSESLNLPVLYSAPLEHESFEAIDALMRDKGFTRDADKRVAFCTADDEARKNWYDFLERRGNRILGRIARKGFVAVPYKDMSDRQREVARLAVADEFETPVDLEHLRMPIDGENSFFIFLSERLVSYCLVHRMSPGLLLLEFLIVNKKYAHTGAAFAALIAFISNIFTYEQRQSVFFVYRDGNREMEALSGRMLSGLIKSVKTRAYYVLKSRGG